MSEIKRADKGDRVRHLHDNQLGNVTERYQGHKIAMRGMVKVSWDNDAPNHEIWSWESPSDLEVLKP